MRHLKAGRKFGRNPSHRRAMFRNLTANLIAHERIETTEAKAKELRRVAERLVSKAVRLGDIAYEKSSANDRTRIARRLHVARQISSFIPRFAMVPNPEGGSPVSVNLVEKVLIDLAKRFQGRPGGYTRIIKLGRRRGDNAPMTIIEFVDRAEAKSNEQGATTAATEAKTDTAQDATSDTAEA